MLVIPALDLHGGKCVRVRNARYVTESAYFADPVAMAKLWRVMNAKVLHLIDLNEYKRKQAPMGLKVTSKAFGFGRRLPNVQNYRG